MTRINIVGETVSLDSPVLVEGFPGVGLVGKMAVDHLIDVFEMTHYATVYCASIPPVVTYQSETHELTTPVRLYVDTDRDLLALQSDVPIGPDAATEFGDCVVDWFDETNVLPLYLSGLPRQVDGEPALYGVASGGAGDRLVDAEIDTPAGMGLISGPTGALLAHALENTLPQLALLLSRIHSDPTPSPPVS